MAGRKHASLFLIIISNVSSFQMVHAFKKNQQTIMVNHMVLFLLMMEANPSERLEKLMTKNECTPFIDKKPSLYYYELHSCVRSHC